MTVVKVCILDYGSGNVKSVHNMVLSVTQNVKVSNEPQDIKEATHLILPGVGAFKTSMDKIHKSIPLDMLKEEVFSKRKPFLGICVGMQVLADKGFEFEEAPGLGWIAGEVVKLDSGDLPLPHVGWNNVSIIRECPLTKRFSENQDFYFVHSFVFRTKNLQDVAGETNYGENFVSIINKDNIYGVQFHPEKSQKAGKILLENFLAL